MPRFILVMIVFLAAFPALSATRADHAYASFDPGDLAWVRQQIKADDGQVEPAFKELLQHVDHALELKPKTVMDKQGLASSGDKHDFYSMAKYAWQGQDSSPGTAYVRRDGYRNPEAQDDQYDKHNFNESVRTINALALAYYFTGKAAYANKAAEFLRAWFIDPRTRMNPDFRYAAVLPGKNDGSYGGIIEGVVLIEMLDYVALLDGSGALSADDEVRLRAWFGSLSDWLVDSDFGKRESRMPNNHASWYRAQVTAFSLYAGKQDRARAMIAPSRLLLHTQFAADGSLPRELARANSAMYSVYGLRSFVTLARLFDHLGDSLWQEKVGGQPALKKALDYLAPYYAGQREWMSGSVRTGVDLYTVQVFRLGGEAYQTKAYDAVLANLTRSRPATDRYTRLLGPPFVQTSGRP